MANFPLNEQKLRDSVHEAVDRESIINVIILLMLVRVVQVISWLRPAERETKTISAENVRVELDTGEGFSAMTGYTGEDGTGPHLRGSEPTFGTMIREAQRQAQVDTTRNTNQHGDRYFIDAWAQNSQGFVSILRVYQNGSADVAHISHFVAHNSGDLRGVPEVSESRLRQLRSIRPAYAFVGNNGVTPSDELYIEYQRAYGPFDRDMELEQAVTDSAVALPEWDKGKDGEWTFEYTILAKCITNTGQVQILHRTPAGDLTITATELIAECIEAPEIRAPYMAFLCGLSDRIEGRNAFQSGYCTPHRNMMTRGADYRVGNLHASYERGGWFHSNGAPYIPEWGQ